MKSQMLTLLFAILSFPAINGGLVSTKQKQYLPRNCNEIPNNTSGYQIIYPFSCNHSLPLKVFCDMNATIGRGWTVIQRRGSLINGTRISFSKNWQEYVNGFRDPQDSEVWLGLHNIHQIISKRFFKLRVDLWDFEGAHRYALYGIFHVGDSADNYTMEVGQYTGNAGDSLTGHNKMAFSTHDRDNDKLSGGSCSKKYGGGGGWWFKNCHDSNLNGLYLAGKHLKKAQGVNWHHWRGYNYSYKAAEMKIKPHF